MKNVQIGIVVYPGAQLSAVLGLSDLFTVAGRIADGIEQSATRLRLRHLMFDQDAEPIVTFDSDPVKVGDDAVPCDILVLPPSLAPPICKQAAAPVANWLRERHSEGSILASVCAGAFLLAETGLIAGRAVTTHWASVDAFRSRFPEILLDTDQLMIDGGDIISVGGLMAWTDLGLKVVERFLGPAVMAHTARMLLVDPPGREQRYYSGFAPRLTHGDAAIVKAQHFLQSNGGKEAKVAELANRQVLKSEPSFVVFKKPQA